MRLRYGRGAGLVAVIACVAALVACTHNPDPEGLAPEAAPGPRDPIKLVARNNGYFDVEVFSLRGNSPSRLGTVGGHDTASYQLVDRNLEVDGTLRLRLRAIGPNTYWISPFRVTVSEGYYAELDINMDGFGNMYRSTLSIAALPDSG